MVVPAGITSVAPSGTVRVPVSTYSFEASSVMVSDTVPLNCTVVPRSSPPSVLAFSSSLHDVSVTALAMAAKAKALRKNFRMIIIIS